MRADLLAHRAVDEHEGRHRVGGGLHREQVELRLRQGLHRGDHHRQVLRPAAGHDGIDGDVLHRRDAATGGELGNHFIGGTLHVLNHARDAFGCGRDDGQSVSPAAFHHFIEGIAEVVIDLGAGGSQDYRCSHPAIPA
jgi:hypothetical protein